MWKETTCRWAVAEHSQKRHTMLAGIVVASISTFSAGKKCSQFVLHLWRSRHGARRETGSLKAMVKAERETRKMVVYRQWGKPGFTSIKKITAFRKINITKDTSLLTACTLAITENVAEQCETGEPLSSSCKSNTSTNLCNTPLKQRTELAGTSKTKLNL